MKNFSYVLLLGAFYIPTSFADTSATGNSQKTAHQQIAVQGSSHQGALRKCTDLLPAGHKYTISIVGTSDKTTQNAKGEFTGKFEVSDETKQTLNQKRAKEVKPFIQCVTETVL
ncbi:hypothetical protein Xbed_02402 [Xenorhabdus beddingii]|uniref:Lipoprotein n=1 Tax=Xenorhabdus beddingii TaxID=40578 RepID=A0A1Y2SKU4_9GAMM|nr:hypothetical protein [Xenorhabdus beddingii]OTA19359.1 hypothetical protein Xbed_02402 [Xenorhabdus beddingii]